MLRLTRRTIAVLVIWMCVFAVRIVAADEITACVNPAGQARLVSAGDACRPQERRVTWNVQGPQGPQGPQGVQGPQGEQGPAGEAAQGSHVPMVVDSVGQVLGPLVSTEGHVLVSVGADKFFAKVTSTGFARGGTLIYNNAACDGAPSMMAPLTQNAVAHPALVNATAAWVVAAPMPNVLPAPNPGAMWQLSRRVIDANSGQVGACTALNWAAAATLWPLKQVEVGHFVTPFAIQ